MTDTIGSEMDKGGKVLVHCHHGQSRSALVVISFLALWEGFWLLSGNNPTTIADSMIIAENWVVKARPTVKPNMLIRQAMSALQNSFTSMS
jgi:hypothetical protein